MAQAGAISTVEWTDEQRRGITTVDRSVLVSAAAGSGKTTILAERCAHLICDAPPPCGVDELLVVTFTEAAAAEMKTRIHKTLRDRATQTPSERLTRQLALVEQAQVGTLHAFCARLLREHFHLVEIDPAFRILDGDDARLLRLETARRVFHEKYEADESGSFHRFIDCYGEGNDEPLMRLIVKAHELLCSLADPNEWLKTQRARVRDAATLPLADSALGSELLARAQTAMKAVRDRCIAAQRQLEKIGGFSVYEDRAQAFLSAIDYWSRSFERLGVDAVIEFVKDTQWPNLPSIPNALPNKQRAKQLIDDVKKEMTEGDWRDLLLFSEREWQDGMRAILPHVDVFLNLVGDFARSYRAAKAELRCLDFADLERYSLGVLRDANEKRALVPSAVARECQNRFRHVLVDEYQDINDVQAAILSLVSRDCLHALNPDQPSNLFCVGDVKQSIYRFRLAEPAQFLERLKRLRAGMRATPPVRKGSRLNGAGDATTNGHVIDLQANFRSRAPLLQAINGLFERLMTEEAADLEYDESHRLVPRLEYPPANGDGCFPGAPIELHVLPAKIGAADDAAAETSDDDVELDRTEREAVLAARRIRQLMGMEPGSKRACVVQRGPDGTLTPRPIRFGDIVILLRSMRFKAEQFARILGESDIAVHAQSVTGYFASSEVRDLVALLNLLDNQRQDIPMAAVLRSPLGNVPSTEDCFARVRLAYPPGADGQEVAFHDAVVRYTTSFDDELAARLSDFLAQLKRWRELAQRRPLEELLRDVFDKTGYLTYCAGLSNGRQRVANLLHLQDRAAQFSDFQQQGLARFIEFLNTLRDEDDLGMPSLATEADDVVRIMSVHRAKGLEFPVVFLPDLGKAINRQDCAGSILIDRTAGLGLHVVDEARAVRYPSLASTLVGQRIAQQVMAEELRVLYVAMTRAKEHLILLGTTPEKHPTEWVARWSEHTGPLPTQHILGARSILDWIGPAGAAADGAGQPLFAVTVYESSAVATWQTPAQQKLVLTPEQERLGRMQPLETEPALNEIGKRVIERLSFKYPYPEFTDMPAAQSVTGRTKGAARAELAPPFDTEVAAPRTTQRTSLQPPRFTAAVDPGPVAVSAVERGLATHSVLEHINFAKAAGRDDVERTIQHLLDRRILKPAEAAIVDRDAITWFLETDVGRMLRHYAADVRHEIPVCFPDPPNDPPGGGDAMDRVMIRGRLDVLLPLPDGSHIVDYKTDAVTGEALETRAAEYAAQMQTYQDAIGRITGIPVKGVHLVFLAARTIKTVGEPAHV